MKYFLDIYALLEIIKGNKNYQRYTKSELYTSVLNLYELFYVLLRDFDKNIAKKYFFQFKENLIKFNDETIFFASEFKLKNKARRVSYTDSLGYSISLQNNLLFLTGDKEFENFENVEFVK